MSDSIYTSLAGALVSQTRLDTVASNLANASTPGFVPERFTSRVEEGQTLPSSGTSLDSSSGARVVTGRSLDAVADGGAFFVVDTVRGERLTRDGSLHQSADGTLVNGHGDAVLTDSGPVQSEFPMTLDADGTVRAEEGPLGRLLLRRLTEESDASREGFNLLRVDDAEDVLDPSIQVGALAVSPISEVASMVEVITATRAVEAYRQAIQASDESERKAAGIGRI